MRYEDSQPARELRQMRYEETEAARELPASRCETCNNPAHVRQAYHPELESDLTPASLWLLLLEVIVILAIFTGIIYGTGVLA